MAPASNEEQFKFLISCIRYSNNGKVDFGQVANECKIVSKGAAAKRYERMMRSHGIAPNAASIKPAPSRIPKTEPGSSQSTSRTPSTSASASSSKKRKTDAFLDDIATGDDEEGFGSGNVKSEPGTGKEREQFMVKEEETTQTQTQMQNMGAMGQLSLDEAANLMQYYDSPATYHGSGAAIEDMGMGGQGHMVEETSYTGSDFGGSASGYHGGSMAGAGAYTMHSQQPSYDFSASYGGGGAVMGGLGRSESAGQSMHYQRSMQLQYSNNQGRSDSAVIVE